MWQRFPMQPIRSSDENAPTVAKERTIACIAACPRRQVGNDHDIEFETFGLMHAEDANHLVVLTHDLRFRLSNARVLRAVTQVSNNVIEGNSGGILTLSVFFSVPVGQSLHCRSAPE